MIIDFWATWCKPCIEELNAIHEEYATWQKETGWSSWLFHSMMPERCRALLLCKMERMAYENYLDPNGDLKRAMNVNMPPHTFVINGKGEIVYSMLVLPKVTRDELYEVVKSKRRFTCWRNQVSVKSSPQLFTITEYISLRFHFHHSNSLLWNQTSTQFSWNDFSFGISLLREFPICLFMEICNSTVSITQRFVDRGSLKFPRKFWVTGLSILCTTRIISPQEFVMKVTWIQFQVSTTGIRARNSISPSQFIENGDLEMTAGNFTNSLVAVHLSCLWRKRTWIR